jgi:hypothetical protein
VVQETVAGREKDLSFVGGLLRHGMVRPEILRERIAQAGLDKDRHALCEARLQRLAN